MNENPPHPSLNETDILEFALCLATHPGDSRTQNAQLLAGQLPDPLPVALPFPEGARVLGSLINNPESISMYFDTYLTPRLALNFYVQHMQDEGWQATSVYRPHRGGVMNPGFQNRGGSETFYHREHGDGAACQRTSTGGHARRLDDR